MSNNYSQNNKIIFYVHCSHSTEIKKKFKQKGKQNRKYYLLNVNEPKRFSAKKKYANNGKVLTKNSFHILNSSFHKCWNDAHVNGYNCVHLPDRKNSNFTLIFAYLRLISFTSIKLMANTFSIGYQFLFVY